MGPSLAHLWAWAQAHPGWAFFWGWVIVSVLSSFFEGVRDFLVETVAMLAQAVRGKPVRRLPRGAEDADSGPGISVEVTLTGGETARRKAVPAPRPRKHRYRPVVSRLSGETVAARCQRCGKRVPLSEVPRKDGEGRCAHSRVAPVDVDGETVDWVCANVECGEALGQDYAVYAEDLPPEAEELQD